MFDQLGFDLEYTDPETKKPVTWDMPDREFYKKFEKAKWFLADLETTGFTPASEEVTLSAKEIRAGLKSRLRARVLTLLTRVDKKIIHAAIDLDKVSFSERLTLFSFLAKKSLFAYNAGFDAFWLSFELPEWECYPEIIDIMLVARVLAPDMLPRFIRAYKDPEAHPEIKSRAYEILMSEGGWSLRDQAMLHLNEFMDKTKQKPKNWTYPFLDQKSKDYAVGDIYIPYRLICKLIGIDGEKQDLLEEYHKLIEKNEILRRVHPQVADIVEMRRKGMPLSKENVFAYVESKRIIVKDAVAKLIAINPELERFKLEMEDLSAGIKQDFKDTFGRFLQSVGISVEKTETNLFKIGEKDLRLVGAEANSVTREIFGIWVSLNKAKKAANMALEVLKFSERSYDGRIHPLLGHGPVTGRLSSKEPNSQQFPKDPAFRAIVAAKENYKIMANDYSALDMRVGGALALRAQAQIKEAYEEGFHRNPRVLRSIKSVYSRQTKEELVALRAQCMKFRLENEAKRKELKDTLDRKGDDLSRSGRSELFSAMKSAKENIEIMRFGELMCTVRYMQLERNTEYWGSLRDAFAIPGMDIHTWTALKMIGRDPNAEMQGLSNKEIAESLERLKKELKEVRASGKVGNLSLLYAMQTNGFKTTAAKNYNIHWSYAEAESIRLNWLESYPEVELWHMWTAFNYDFEEKLPDEEFGGKEQNKKIFRSYTLGGRLTYAKGLNAALSYEDQSTGADILGLVMNTLRTKHNRIFKCAINQVHDELVFELPAESVESDTQIVTDVMVESAHEFTFKKWGVRVEVSPLIGDVWLKD